MARKLDSSKAAFWTERLKRFETSSLTVAGFCAQEGCSTAAFFRWRRRLRKPPTAKGNRRSGSGGSQPRPSPSERFRPLSITLSPPQVGIQFPSGTRLELAGDDHELVCRVVREILRGDSQTSLEEA